MTLQGADVGCVSHFSYCSPKKVYVGSQFEATIHHSKQQREVAGHTVPEVTKQRLWRSTQLFLFM